MKSNYNKQNQLYPRKEFIYHLGCEAGFFSEYNNMILALLYCLQNQIDFSLYSKDANFAYEKGWNDYFLPFCEEKGSVFHRWFNRRPNSRFKNHILRALDNQITQCFRVWNGNRLTTADLWDEFRSLSLSDYYDIPEFQIEGDLRSACQKLIQQTWRYNKQTEMIVQNYVNSLNLPAQYAGFHIRGGDKFIEAPLLSVEPYIQKVQSLSSIKNVFVLTDDYSIIELLQKNYPDWNFYTLCTQEEHGYYHQNFKKQSKTIIRDQHIKLFASIDILAASDLFVGTFSSNPGMYLGMRMDRNKAYSVDIPEWEIW